MGAMKTIATGLESLGYDMTTVTLRDVLRPVAGETEAQRMRRLAAKAIIEGCVAYYLPGDAGRFAVTSGSTAGTAYLVDPHAGTCQCGARGVCKHRALVTFELGEMFDLPLPEGEAPARMAA